MDSPMLMIRVNVTLVYKNIHIWFVKPICFEAPKSRFAIPCGAATHSLRSSALHDHEDTIKVTNSAFYTKRMTGD